MLYHFVGLVPDIPVPICSGYRFRMGFLEHVEYFGLEAENDEVVDGLIDLLEMRGSLMSVLRTGYTMDPSSSVSGRLSAGGGLVAQSDPLVEPFPLPVQGVARHLLSRGGKRYALKKEEARNTQASEGDILTVVSDLRLGVETGSIDWIVEYCEADVVRVQDYYPFGMARQDQSYGSTGVEKGKMQHFTWRTNRKR